MLDLRLLRFFIAIFEEKNITAAARVCHVSQPSLSAGLKQLEQELGGPLFYRSKQGVQACDSAHYLYPLAVKLVAEARALPSLFKEKACRQTLRIAVIPSLSQGRLSTFLKQVATMLGRLDLALVDQHASADCRLTLESLREQDEIFFPLWEEDYVICVPVDHPLAQQKSINAEQLQGLDFIECPPCEAHQQTIGLLACHHMPLNLVAKADSKSLVIPLVLAGLGISFLPEGLIEDEPRLQAIPFDGPRMFRRVGLCYSSHQSLDPTLARLIRALA